MNITKPLTTLLIDGDTLEAILECDALIAAQEDPQVGLFLLRAMAHSLRRENPNAIRDLTHFLTNAEDTNALTFAHYLRAECFEQMGQWKSARGDLNTTIEYCQLKHKELLPELYDRRERVGLKLAGNLEDDTTSDDVISQPTIGQAFDQLEQGNLEEVLVACDFLLTQENKDSTALFARGLANDFLGRRQLKSDQEAAKGAAQENFQAALDDYSAAIAFAVPRFHLLMKAYERRAQMFFALNQYDKAILDLNKIRDREPENFRAVLHSAMAKTRLHRFDDAIHDLEQVPFQSLEAPDLLDFLDLKGQIALSLSYYQEALSYYQEAQRCTEAGKATAIRLKTMETLTLYLQKAYPRAVELMQTIESELMELQENERRELQPKLDLLRQHLPQIDEQSSEPEEQIEMEIEGDFFNSQKSAKEICETFFKWLMLALGVQHIGRRNTTY